MLERIFMWKNNFFLSRVGIFLPLIFLQGCSLATSLLFEVHRQKIKPYDRQELLNWARSIGLDAENVYYYQPVDSSYESRKEWLLAMDKLNTDSRTTMFELHVNYYDSSGNLLSARIAPYCPKVNPSYYSSYHQAFLERDTALVSVDTTHNLFSLGNWYNLVTNEKLKPQRNYKTYIVLTMNHLNINEFAKGYKEYYYLRDSSVQVFVFNTDMPKIFEVKKKQKCSLRETLRKMARTAQKEEIKYRYYFKFF